MNAGENFVRNNIRTHSHFPIPRAIRPPTSVSKSSVTGDIDRFSSSPSQLQSLDRLSTIAFSRGNTGHLREVEKRVAHILATESSDGPWSARDGMCLDLAAKWHERLKKEGIESHIAAVDPSLEGLTLPLNGKKIHGKFHAYLVIGEGKEQLILDGSVQQFFDGPEKRDDLPKVFLGSPQELRTLFSQHRGELRLEVAGDPHVGKYPPEELADFVYGLGHYGEARELLN